MIGRRNKIFSFKNLHIHSDNINSSVLHYLFRFREMCLNVWRNFFRVSTGTAHLSSETEQTSEKTEKINTMGVCIN